MGMTRKVKRNTTKAIVTISEAFERFTNEKEALGKVSKTIDNYKKSLGYFMEHYELNYDTTDINSVTRDLFLGWAADMREDGKSAATINHYLRDCRAFFYWCMGDDRKYIEPSFKIDMVSAQEPDKKTYSKTDIDRLLKKPKNENDYAEWRTWVIVNLIYDMGARAGTVLEIQLGDINFKRRTLYLRHTKNKALSHKTISSYCAKLLKEFVEDWRADAETEDYLFCNVSGEQLTYNALAHSFQRYCKERNVERASLHGIRHTFATELAENTNGDMIKVQKALGHSSIDMARKYVDIAAVDMGNYDIISPLSKTKKSNKSRPVKVVKKSK